MNSHWVLNLIFLKSMSQRNIIAFALFRFIRHVEKLPFISKSLFSVTFNILFKRKKERRPLVLKLHILGLDPKVNIYFSKIYSGS